MPRTEQNQQRRLIACLFCGEVRRIRGRGRCAKCYTRWWIKRHRLKYVSNPASFACSNCGGGPHAAKSLCSPCYERARAQTPEYQERQRRQKRDGNKRRLINCAGCGLVSPLKARDRCTTCYRKLAWAVNLEKYRLDPESFNCAQCGGGPHKAKGLCQRCYGNQRIRPDRPRRRRPPVKAIEKPRPAPVVFECPQCGEGPHKAKGLCERCYRRTRPAPRRRRPPVKAIEKPRPAPVVFECPQCGEGPHKAKGLCERCYRRTRPAPRRRRVEAPANATEPKEVVVPVKPADETTLTPLQVSLTLAGVKGKGSAHGGASIMSACEVSPDCLECPLPVCRFDPGGAEALAEWRKKQEAVAV